MLSPEEILARLAEDQLLREELEQRARARRATEDGPSWPLIRLLLGDPTLPPAPSPLD